MANVGLQTQTASVGAGLIRAAEINTNVAVTLLKKALASDENLVATLLAPPAASGLDIRA